MAEPGHSLSKGPEAPRAVTPQGKARWITRVRATIDQRLTSLSQKLSIMSALLLCATPLLLVHASSPPKVAATAPAIDPATQSVIPPPAPGPGIEIVRTRPVTTATTPPAPSGPAPAKPAASTPAPSPDTAGKAAAPVPQAAPEAAPPAWTDTEVNTARQQCATLLEPLKVMVQDLPPIRQDKCGTPAPVAFEKARARRRWCRTQSARHAQLRDGSQARCLRGEDPAAGSARGVRRARRSFQTRRRATSAGAATAT